MTAHFCTISGARIASPGVSKAVDPINGVDECDPPPVAPKKAGVECGQCLAHEQSLKDVCAEQEKLEGEVEVLKRASAASASGLADALAKLSAAELALVEANKTIEELTKPAAPPIEQPKAEKADKSAAGGKGK